MRAFVVLGLATGLWGCTTPLPYGEVKGDDTDFSFDTDPPVIPPTPTDSDTDTAPRPDSVFVMFGYMGDATVDLTNGTYTGEESLYVYERDNNTFIVNESIENSSALVMCEVTWPVTGSVYPSAAATPCVDWYGNTCDFSFDLSYGVSARTGGTAPFCTALLGGTRFSKPMSRIGYHSNYLGYSSAFMQYFSGTYQGYPYAGWYAVSGAYRFGNTNFVSYDSTSGDFWWDFPLFGYYQLPNPRP